MILSAIVIVKNEENMIQGCLDSVAFCDEIVVIDAGSADKTVEICKKSGAHVFTVETTDFAEARNIGCEKAKGEWLLYVDADERVTKELAENIIKQISQRKQEVAAFRIFRKNYYLGRHAWPKIEKLERLLRKSRLKRWYGMLHESPEIDGVVADLPGLLLHYTHRDLSSMLEKTLQWSQIEAKLRFDAGHPAVVWWRFPRVMISAFYDSYMKQEGYKVGVVGLIEGIYQAFSMFVTYARLWEMQHEKN